MDILGMQLRENRLKLKTTVLCRVAGKWYPGEVGKIVNGCMTEACQHPQYPEHLILSGHYTKAKILEALGGGQAFIVTQMVGVESLPFRPSFIA